MKFDKYFPCRYQSIKLGKNFSVFTAFYFTMSFFSLLQETSSLGPLKIVDVFKQLWN